MNKCRRFAFLCSATALLFIARNLPAQSSPQTFPVPTNIQQLSDAVTPREYEAVAAAIEAEMKKPAVQQEVEQGPGLGPLEWIRVDRIALGSLGEGVVAEFNHSPACGTGGCPMWVFVHHGDAYRSVIRGGGWSFATVPSGGSVPDIVLYWQMGAEETDVARYRYRDGKFVSVEAKPKKCMGEEARGACAGRNSSRAVNGISLAEYKSLWEEMKSARQGLRVSSWETFSEEAHAIEWGLVNDTTAVIAGLGACTREKDCGISVYGCKQSYAADSNLPKCEYWPMLQSVRGWGAAMRWDDKDAFAPRTTLIVARRKSPSEIELHRYAAVTKGAGPVPGTTLKPDGCEVLTSKTRVVPKEWKASSFLVHPIDCTGTEF